jgi:hypothetical protein
MSLVVKIFVLMGLASAATLAASVAAWKKQSAPAR